MEKPLLEIKPSIINALGPLFLKYVWYSLLISIIGGVIAWLIDLVGLANLSPLNTGLIVFGIAVLLSLLWMLERIIILRFTTYFFYKGHVASQFNFIIIKSLSAVYDQIVNVKVEISIWDRLCNAGDIILHTAEDIAPDVRLLFIKNPLQMEQSIHRLIAQQGSKHISRRIKV